MTMTEEDIVVRVLTSRFVPVLLSELEKAVAQERGQRSHTLLATLERMTSRGIIVMHWVDEHMAFSLAP